MTFDEAKDLSPGDGVRLSGGGPAMTVVGTSSANDSEVMDVECTWIDGVAVGFSSFEHFLLTRTKGA